MFKQYFVSVSVLLVGLFFGCNKVEKGQCREHSKCEITLAGQNTCMTRVEYAQEDACQDWVEKNFLDGVVARGCNACTPNPTQQAINLTLQGNPTCPVTTTHSNTYETPGCWCNIFLVGRRCCYCLNNCYTTDTWTTTEQVPAPPYGSCP